MRFRNRVVLVTGAASGMGQALCEVLGAEGATLGLLDRSEAGLQTVAQSLRDKGSRCEMAVADVRQRSQVRAAIDELAAALGPIDTLIASAGICGLSGVEDLQVEQVEDIMQINFLGVVYALEAVLPDMLRRGSGHVVGIASLAALGGLPFESAYCASKAALASYLESLRPQLRRRGVLVTTIFPGFVQTPLLTNLTAKVGDSAFRGVVSVETAAHTIVKAIARRYRVCSFPRSTSWLMRAARFLPAGLYDRVMTRLATRYTLPY